MSAQHCCDTTMIDTVLREISNLPGLAAIEYRIGRYADFRAYMRKNLLRSSLLSKLTTEESSDPALSLIDAWAVVLDVLTFYQERIANENYLLTASEYRSVLELAKLAGYSPAPGTAATCYIAFSADLTGLTQDDVQIDSGTKIQSQPAQDESPQVFETLEDLVALPDLNELPVRAYKSEVPTGASTSAYFTGTSLDVSVGDMLLFILELGRGSGNYKFYTARVETVEVDDERGVTRLEWGTMESIDQAKDMLDAGEILSTPAVFNLKLKASLFAYNAVDLSTYLDSVPAGYNSADWKIKLRRSGPIYLDTVYDGIAAGSWMVITKPKRSDMVTAARIDTVTETVYQQCYMSGKVTKLTLKGKLIKKYRSRLNAWNTVVHAGSDELFLDKCEITEPLCGSILEFDDLPTVPESGRTLLVRGKRPTVMLKEDPTLYFLEQPPVTVGTGEDPDVSLVLRDQDGEPHDCERPASEITYLPALESDEEIIGEAVTVSSDQANLEDGFLRIDRELSYAYDRSTTTVYGNVAYASQGETVSEVLGSASALLPFQKLALSSSPETFLASAGESGCTGTLEIRVNDVLFAEVPTLYSSGPTDRVYTAKLDEDQKTVVQFGDGIHGARPESGVDNIEATYRVGSGTAGQLQAEQLATLLTRPLGLKEAYNPLPTSGGSDADEAENIRQSIPASVLTLGRVVSVSDFKAYAERYPGIAKAQASQVWSGQEQVMHISVVGDGGAEVDTTALKAGLDSVREPGVKAVIDNAQLVSFGVELGIIVDETYEPDTVLTAVKEVLTATFDVDNRTFGERLTAADLEAAAHTVDGVVSVAVSAMDFGSAGASITAEPARLVDGVLLPAQLLIIDADNIVITECSDDL